MPPVLTSTPYRFTLDLLTPNGKRIDEIALNRVDFDRAIEATFFDALRHGEITEYAFAKDQARIIPCFPSANPSSAGFDIAIGSSGYNSSPPICSRTKRS